MSASPFRSHLLQQWARSTQGRAPAAVVPWLNKSSSSHPREIDREDDERRLLEREYLAHLHPESTHITPPSISTLDSASTVTAFAATTVSSSLWARPPAKAPQNNSIRRSQSRDGSGRTSSDAIISAKLASRVSEEHRGTSGGSRSLHSTPPHPSSSSYRQEYDLTEQEQNIAHDSELAASFQSFLQSRRTATRLQSEEEEEQQRKILIPALNRAVQCAQMAPNHKRTEPFSFRRFVAGSEAARQLADISYEVTLRKTESHPNAESKRQKWLQIPAFLVTLVHGNQAGIDDIESSSDNDPYQALPYTPPETEKQLEDYAAASAAVQNVLLSLHAEGIGSKWATGPVIRTPAFRELVQALPTDRIVALIMVGGSTEFGSEREAQITVARRRRRRSIHGDLMVDLS